MNIFSSTESAYKSLNNIIAALKNREKFPEGLEQYELSAHIWAYKGELHQYKIDSNIRYNGGIVGNVLGPDGIIGVFKINADGTIKCFPTATAQMIKNSSSDN